MCIYIYIYIKLQSQPPTGSGLGALAHDPYATIGAAQGLKTRRQGFWGPFFRKTRKLKPVDFRFSYPNIEKIVGDWQTMRFCVSSVSKTWRPMVRNGSPWCFLGLLRRLSQWPAAQFVLRRSRQTRRCSPPGCSCWIHQPIIREAAE